MGGAVHQAYCAIRNGILKGEISSGSHLRAGDIANQLGISRTPVREALRRLDAEGLVDLVANQGAYVTSWDWTEIENVFDIRIMLESYAAELGAKHLSDHAIEELAELDAKMRSLVKSQPARFIDEVRDHNARFHRIIIEGSMNRRLGAVVGAVAERHLIMRTYQSFTQRDLARSMENHSELVEALRARNGAWASSVMKSHLFGAKQVIIRDRVEAESRRS